MNTNLFDPKFLAPKGSVTPKVYFVSESPDSKDLEKGTYTSPDYNPLFRCINELGLNSEEARFYYAVPYRPKNTSNSYERKLEDNELLEYSKYVLADIKKTNPEVIVCLGRNTSKIFGMNEPSVRALRHIEGKFNNIPIIFTYSAGYFNQNDGINSNDQKSWYSDIKKAFNYKEHKERGNKIENIEYQLLDYSEVDKLEEIFFKEEKLVLDYEASSLRPLLNKNFHIGGIGLYGMDSQKAIYIYIYDFFRRNQNNSLQKEYLTKIGDFLSKRKVIVFNAQYECAATVKFFEKQLTNLEDVMQLGRTLSETGGLKEIASRRLGLPVWTDKIEEWNECFVFLVEALKKKKVVNKDEYEDVKETTFLKENPDKTIFDLAEFIESYKDEKVFSTLKSTYKDFITNKDLTKEVVRNSNISVKKFWSLMQANEVEFYNSFTFHSSKRGYKFETFMNETIPLLNENIFTDKKWNECLTIKAVETLQILKRFENMLSEVFIEKEKLDEVKKELTTYVIERVDSDNFNVNFAEIPRQIVAPYCINDVIRTGELYTNLLEEIKAKNLLGALEVYNDQELLGVELENNGIAWDDDKASKLEELYYDTLLTCGKSIILSSRMKKVLELTDQDIIKIQTTVNRDDLKPYFNPLSTLPSAGTRAKLSRALCSIRFKITMLFYEVHKEIEEIGEDKMPKYFPVFYPVYKQLRETKTFKERLEFIDSISKVENLRDRLLAAKGKDQLELQTFDKYAQYELESMDSKTTNDIYFGFRKILLIDPLDKTTWLEEFKLIVDFKTYKRAEKYRGTYIKAKLGRFNVSIVDKEDCKNNFFERKGLYINEDRKNDDQVYLNETEYGVNTAATRRWRSGAHTVPAGVELMDLRISRFENGVRLHFDYCMTEDSKILLSDGKSISIKELKNNYENGITNFVFSKNIETGEIESKPILDVFETKYVSELIEISIGKEIIQVTPDHKFILKNNSIVFAEDLKESDKIEFIEGYVKCQICNNFYNQITKDHLKSHRISHIEYKNKFNSAESRFTSLIKKFKKEGKKLSNHQIEQIKLGAYRRWESNDEKTKCSERMKRFYSNPIEREKQSERTKIQWKDKEIKKKMSEGISKSFEKRKETSRFSIGKCGWYEGRKSKNKFYYKSSYEEKFADILESDFEVCKYEYEPFRVSYVENDVRKSYRPDFLVTLQDNSRYLVEVKPLRFIDDYKKSLKYLAALETCKALNISFTIVSEVELGIKSQLNII